MIMAVFGANGKVGSLVVAEALRRGHSVVAFVHSKSIFDNHNNLRIVQGDIYDAISVTNVLSGSQAVISALGSLGTPKKDILSTGMQHIIPAMKANKIERIVSLTGAGANASGDQLSFINKAMHGFMDLLAHKILDDGEEHIRLLQNSQLSWTVLRSPIMNTLGNSKQYNLTSRRPFSFTTINRHSVATAMVDLTENLEFQQQSPFITR